MKTNDATIGDELTIELTTTLKPWHAMNHVNKTQAAVLAVVKWPVEAWHIYIYRNQNGGDEQSERNVKRTATAMPSKADTEQHEDEESCRCREAKDEEQSWDAYADRNLNEAPSFGFLNVRVHNSARMSQLTTRLSEPAD